MAGMAHNDETARLDPASFYKIAEALTSLLLRTTAVPSLIQESSKRVASSTAARVLNTSENSYRAHLKATYIAAQTLLFNFQSFKPHFREHAAVTDISAGFVTGAGAVGPFAHGSWAFGVVIQCEAIVGNEQALVHLGDIDALGSPFPVFALYSQLVEQSGPAVIGSPLSGSCALWVKPRTTRSWNRGLLTARHVVDASFSSVEIWPTGTSGPISSKAVEYTRCTIDAAVIDAGGIAWPSGLTAVAIAGFPFSPIAPGATIEIEGRHTTAKGSVLRVHQDVPYVGILFGQRLIIDTHGVPGDSGGAVRVLPSRMPCGLYIGAFSAVGAGSATHGVAQNLFQVTDYFNLECFQ